MRYIHFKFEFNFMLLMLQILIAVHYCFNKETKLVIKK